MYIPGRVYIIVVSRDAGNGKTCRLAEDATVSRENLLKRYSGTETEIARNEPVPKSYRHFALD